MGAFKIGAKVSIAGKRNHWSFGKTGRITRRPGTTDEWSRGDWYVLLDGAVLALLFFEREMKLIKENANV